MIVQISRMRDGVRRLTHITEVIGMEGEVVITQDLFTYEFKGEATDGGLERYFQEHRSAAAFPAACGLLRPRQGADGGHRLMFGNGALSLDAAAMVIAAGFFVTVVAVVFVFGGFFAERRLRDRLEDLDARTRSGPRMIQMATLKRVEKAGRLPTLDKLLWRWFPNASSVRQKLQTSGMSVTLGDFVFASLALAVAAAFLLYLVLDVAPGVALLGSLSAGFRSAQHGGRHEVQEAWQKVQPAVPRGGRPDRSRALRAGLPIQEAVSNVARDIKDPVGGVFKRARQGRSRSAYRWRRPCGVSQDGAQLDEFNFSDRGAVDPARDRGGNLAETLANLSQLLRARQQLRLKIRAFTSEARTTMLIMAGLPFLVGGGLFVISPDYISPLLTTSTGQMVAARGCSMGLGIFIMNKIATIKV